MRGMEDAQMTTFEISPKFTLFWGHIGAKLGVKWPNMCPSPNKTPYKCYI